MVPSKFSPFRWAGERLVYVALGLVVLVALAGAIYSLGMAILTTSDMLGVSDAMETP